MTAGAVCIDALLVRPLVQTVAFGTGPAATTLAGGTLGREQTARVTPGAHVQRFRQDGSRAGTVTAPPSGRVALPAGGFALVR